MKKTVVPAGVLLGLVLAAPARSEDQGGSTHCTGITVRVWNTLPAETAVIQRAKTVAEQVFGRSGVGITWIDCALDDVRCPEPNGFNEVSVRIYRRRDAERRKTGRSTGGAAVTGRGGARIVHLHYDRLEEMSTSRAIPLELAVGITTAHEIGHLLLARGHSLVGIMRPTFDAPEWRLAQQGLLLFAPRESRLLRRGSCQLDGTVARETATRP